MPALDLGDSRPLNFRIERQFKLRDACGFAQAPQISSKCEGDGVGQRAASRSRTCFSQGACRHVDGGSKNVPLEETS